MKPFYIEPHCILLASLALMLSFFTQASAKPLVRGFDNGAWCWFQDERVVIDQQHPDGTLILLTAISFSLQGGESEAGDLDLHWINAATGERGSFELHDRLEPDDHNTAALFIRDDGRYLAVYTKHSTDNVIRRRISTNPHDPSAWQQEQTIVLPEEVCYSNLFEATNDAGKKVLYNFHRSIDWDPNYLVSDDQGTSWQYGGKLLTGSMGKDREQRPYLQYAAGPADNSIHFVATDGHPRNWNNGLYHGYLKDGMLHWSDGAVKGPLSSTNSSPHRSNEFTAIMTAKTKFDGVPLTHAWSSDVEVDSEGHPYVLFTARRDGSVDDHRFCYARWMGDHWRVRQIAKAGGYLYQEEDDYTGLGALHPNNPDVLFISTDIDPRNDTPLDHYEIFMGTTTDDGDSWLWAPVTHDSNVDNLRPIVSDWTGGTALLWLHGEIRTYENWNAGVKAKVVGAEELEGLFAEGFAPPVYRKALAPDRPPQPITPLSSEITPQAVGEAGQRVAYWQINAFWEPPSYGPHSYWRYEKNDWVWAPFYIGLHQFAEATDRDVLSRELSGLVADIGWELREPKRFADHWAVAWTYAEEYIRHGEEEMIRPTLDRFNEIMQESWDESLEWKNDIHHRELAWCDALYMGPPTLLHLSLATGDMKYHEFGDFLWWKTTDYLYDDKWHLYYRDSRFFDVKEKNGRPRFWSRGVGWVAAGLTRMLQEIPQDHPNRERYEKLFREMAGALKDAQPDSGYWATGLLDPSSWPQHESSGTAFHTHMLAWGINHGLLDRDEYYPAVERGWQALVSSVRNDGWLQDIQPIGDDPYSFNEESVMPYGVGGFLMAAAEVYKLALLDGHEPVALEYSNPHDKIVLDEIVVLDWPSELPAVAMDSRSTVVVLDASGGDLIRPRLNDSDADGVADELVFSSRFFANQTKQFLVYDLSKRAH